MKGVCLVRYQQIKLKPRVQAKDTSDSANNECLTPSLSPLPLTVNIPEDTTHNKESTTKETASPHALVPLSVNHSSLPVIQFPSSQSSPPETPVKDVDSTTFQHSDSNVRSVSHLPMTPESPPSPSKSKHSARKSSNSKPSQKSGKEVNSSSSKSKKKLLSSVSI